MKQLSIIAIIVLTALEINALELQYRDGSGGDHYLSKRTVTKSQPSAQLNLSAPTSEITSWLKQGLINLSLPQSELKLVSERTSMIGRHYLFQQWFNGQQVYMGHVKLNVDFDGNIISMYDLTVHDFWLKQGDLQTTDEWIVFDGHQATSGNMTHELTENAYWETIKRDNKALITVNLARYLQPNTVIDTVVTGNVFMPDPLTSAGVTYGGSYSDNDDAANAFLDAEMSNVSVAAQYDTETSTFILENDYVVIHESQGPTVDPATSVDGTFDFDRSESGFEDYNAFYHITTYIDHLLGLGFEDLINFKIYVDTHAHNGGDNSSFIPGSQDRLRFGEGGVDDAEDADVVVHEYAHALSASASPSTNIGSERQALDEGLGDYVAASYSYDISEYLWGEIFTWDGHNEYWEGRRANTTKVYPEELQNDKHKDGEMWASALMEINMTIGREQTDLILFNSLYNWVSNMELSDAATEFMATDSFLNDGLYQETICNIFKTRGLTEVCEVGVTEMPSSSDNVTLLNTTGFAYRNESLTIQSQVNDFTAHLIDATGRLVQTVKSEAFSANLSPLGLPGGVYLIHVDSSAGQTNYKIQIAQ